MKKKINKTFLLFCSVLLAIPFIFLLIRVKLESKFSSEKINGNFENNFPLKEDYFGLYSYLKETCLKVDVIPDKVLDIKNNGWLLCGDYWSNNLSESLRYINFKNEELITLEENLKVKQKWCSENNIKYFIAIAPNKETIYPELVPFKRKNSKSKLEQTENLCHKLGVGFINLGAQFPENKYSPLLYHKTDTHWTAYAGYFGYLETLKQINKNLRLSVKAIPITNFKAELSKEIIGDLDFARGKEKSEFAQYMVPINFKADYYVAKKKLTAPSDYEFDPNIYESRLVSKNKDLKILFLHDSFGRFVTYFAANHFGEVVNIWKHEFNYELIQKEKPDIIIQEFVERHIDFLLEKNN